MEVTPARSEDTAELAAVAAQCFPLACPPAVSGDDIAAFIAENLSGESFRGYLADPDRAVFVARDDGQIVGYAMLVADGAQIELSKMYVVAGHHGGGAATALLRRSVDWAAGRGAAAVWLGVNRKNERAQRFYRKHGFEVTGTRTFRLGQVLENDYVMRRAL